MTAKLKLPLFLFGLALAGVVWATASVGNVQEDLFIYRAGASLPLRGLSPYDAEALRADVAGQYSGSPQLIANCGFFLTPQAVAVFTPFAFLPWDAARAAWTGLSFAVPLKVGAGAAHFRTWAFTRRAHEAGEWTVVVRDQGRVLARQSFTVTK